MGNAFPSITCQPKVVPIYLRTLVPLLRAQLHSCLYCGRTRNRITALKLATLVLTVVSALLIASCREAAQGQNEPGSIPVVLDLERPSDTDILMLRNGDNLTGTVLNESFSICTSYAQITLNSPLIAGIDLDGGADNIEAIVTVNNNRFSGFIDDPVFVFKLQGGARIEVRREKVLKVVFRVRDKERKGLHRRQFFVLKNGDYFSGKVLNEAVQVATTYAQIPVSVADVERVVFIGGRKPLTTITLLNGDKVQGVLSTEDIEVDLDVGGRIKVYQDRIDTMYCIVGYVPDDIPCGMPFVSGQQVVLDLGNDVKMTFALIPPGEFVMGSPASELGRYDNEGPQHQVTLTKPYYMGITEVTQAQYQIIMGNNPSKFAGSDLPVEHVSWNDAAEFCVALSDMTGRIVRLPTEAEWEYACRAGTTTRFGFGDSDSQLSQYEWYKDNSGGQTHPVGQKSPNPFGLFDMHGNVMEWCNDWHGEYSQEAVTNPTGTTTKTNPSGATGGFYCIERGGNWYLGPEVCRSAFRAGGIPDYRSSGTGFRVVLDVN
ncbi:MAG: formylglycine-generating enzyme family protein [Planctomycetes bacterium]|nr:formylglycine-generating enzyme family protein [Planctomycetota bacterium]NOG55163.1 formylglycine-generating enzyme family protein [Planctomycetota bacterium]